jgi:acyl-CoA thioester hydrolase
MFMYYLQPRFSETDALGHINNSALPVWLEEARVDVFRIFNPSLQTATWNLILKKYDIEFLEQIWRTEPVEIQTSIEHIGNSSLTVLQRVRQAGKEVVRGRTVLVHFDYKTNRPAPIPEDIKKQLEEHREQENEA